jgi:hypothetical protein
MAIGKNDQAARVAWGEAYDEIPKSVFALVAWHLSNLTSENCDADGAAATRFLQEWRALVSHGASPPTKRVRALLEDAA